MPVDPRHALLLTWHDDMDAARPVTADRELLRDLNLSTVQQAEAHRCHRPGGTPPHAPRLHVPLSMRLIEGYRPAAAYRSTRRENRSADRERHDRQGGSVRHNEVRYAGEPRPSDWMEIRAASAGVAGCTVAGRSLRWELGLRVDSVDPLAVRMWGSPGPSSPGRPVVMSVIRGLLDRLGIRHPCIPLDLE